MKNSKFARVLKRLLGEETGATMMEYVILAVMIAAAVTAAAIYFGNSTKNQMQVAGDAMVGNTMNSENRDWSSEAQQHNGVAKGNASALRFKQTTGGDSDASAQD